MKTRNWSIRSKIIALVAVPVSALLALWIFATVLTIGPAFNLLSAQTLLDTVGKPGEVLVAELQKERKLSVVQLSREGPTAPLDTQRAGTDRAVADFRSAAGSSDARRAAGPQLQSRIDQVSASLDGLADGRVAIDRRAIEPSGAQELFNSIIDSAFRMFSATATFDDPQIDREIRALTMIGRGREWLSRSDSLLAGGNAAGQFTGPEAGALIQAVGTQRYLYTEAVADLPTEERDNYERLTAGDAFARLQDMQDVLVQSSRAGAAPPVGAGDWQPAYDSAVQQLRAFEINATEALTGRTMPVAVDILLRLALAGILGLTAVIVSIVVSVRVGRSLIGRLIRLRAAALQTAGDRLPSVVRRLRRGESVDVDAETPPLEYGIDEIGQLGRAFTEVQRTAVQSAVDEAGVRRGLNEVFLNIARRSQTLLHRQLALLDRMERRETDSQELEDLYRVDHLATRMRRHAEDLVILAGAAPGRGWRNPVPLIDVVRGAISEVEDYKRVDIVSVESSAVLGRAVGDVIHLLAELLENAASFSPPQTRVQVVGQVLPNGYALEIEDRGLGMSPEALAEANRKLLEPPDFDPADSARLGLFVVAQLADRHSIRVSLRPSGYGGVTAVVLIPGELVTTGQGQAALPAGPTPPDKSWDRPLVGTGTEDPARSSLGALQWQGTEQVRSIAMTGRPVTINGTATAGPELTDDTVRPGSDRHEPATATGADVGDPTRPLSRHTLGLSDTPVAEPAEPAATPGGPAPSAVVDGLTEDGLVQRRRTKPRRGSGQRAAPPALLPPNLTSPDGLASAPGSSAPGSAAAGFPASGSPTPARPASLSSDFPSAGNGRTTTNGNGLTGAGLNVPGVGGPALNGPGVAGPTLDGPGVGGPALDGPGLNGPALDGAGLDGLSLDGPLRHGEGPAMLGTPPQVPPRIPSPRIAPDAMPATPKAMPPVAPAMPKDVPADDPSADDADEPLLPRRVRQASLAPQLRGPVAEQTAAPSRSPEQVRSLMSALQQGTTRGRREAAGLAAAAAGSAPDDRAGNGPETDKQQTVGEPMWSEAATVIFPAVQGPVAAGSDNSTDNAPENHENRPDKDA